MINDGEIAIIVILGINFLIFVVLIGYVYIKIRPMFEKLNGPVFKNDHCNGVRIHGILDNKLPFNSDKSK